VLRRRRHLHERRAQSRDQHHSVAAHLLNDHRLPRRSAPLKAHASRSGRRSRRGSGRRRHHCRAAAALPLHQVHGGCLCHPTVAHHAVRQVLLRLRLRLLGVLRCRLAVLHHQVIPHALFQERWANAVLSEWAWGMPPSRREAMPSPMQPMLARPAASGGTGTLGTRPLGWTARQLPQQRGCAPAWSTRASGRKRPLLLARHQAVRKCRCRTR